MASIVRKDALKSMPSKTVTRPSNRQTLPRCRSPCSSRTKPASRRARHSGASAASCACSHATMRCNRARSCASRARASHCAGDSAVAACRSDINPKPSAHTGRAVACRDAIWSARASMRSAHTALSSGVGASAREAVSGGTGHVAASSWSSVCAGSKRRMQTAKSAASADGGDPGSKAPASLTPTTPRYSAGAVRRLSRSSSSQPCWRAARLRWSMKPRSTAFLSL